MNPLVEKMLIAQREGIDVRTLEQIFEHEAKCESKHEKHHETCSENVTHLFKGHKTSKKMCLIAATRIQRLMDDGARCFDCDLPVRECWTIRPI